VGRPLVIVKTGSTIPSLTPRYGDFDEWIVRGLGPAVPPVVVWNAAAAEPPPTSVGAVVVTGSPAMVSDREPWSEATASWLAARVEEGLPTLGICYGHQLLAHALGGQVGANPRGREIGTITVHLKDAADEDPLLGSFGRRLRAQATHVESVIRLPESAVALGFSEGDPHQAFRIGRHAWGLQFHPEFGVEVMRGYVEYRWPVLEAEGLDVDGILAALEESPLADRILRRFARVVWGRGDAVSRPSGPIVDADYQRERRMCRG